MSSRQDALEERLSSLEDKLQGLQVSLISITTISQYCLSQAKYLFPIEKYRQKLLSKQFLWN